MAGLEVKGFDSPDETRPFSGKGRADYISLGAGPVLKGVFESGWRWSEHVKPIAGNEKRRDRCSAS